MSRVTSVTLIFDTCEESTEKPRLEDETYTVLDEINAWLTNENFGTLKMVHLGAGGSKLMGNVVACAGFNYFHCESEFLAFVLTRKWTHPENFVLVIQPEEGHSRVVFMPG